jgi:hypothetical protein
MRLKKNLQPSFMCCPVNDMLGCEFWKVHMMYDVDI